MNRSQRYLPALLALVVAGSMPGCGMLLGHKPSRIPEAATQLVVMPLERDEPKTETGAGSKEPALLPKGAEDVVTAQIYGVLTSRSRWIVVPDLTAAQALRDISKGEPPAERARALGRAVKADAVLYGTVSRFRERVGTDYGAREPASVAFKLNLLLPENGKMVWSEAFNQTQRPLSSNLFDWWMFWRAGPHWFTAQELSRLGVEKLMDDLESK